MFNLIRWRLTLWYVAILAAIIVIFGLGFFLAAQNILLNEQDREIRRTAETLASTIDLNKDKKDARKDGKDNRDGNKQTVDDGNDTEPDNDEDDDNGDTGSDGKGDGGELFDDDLFEGDMSLTLTWIYVATPDGWSANTAPIWLTSFPHKEALDQSIANRKPSFLTIRDQKETIRLYTLPVFDKDQPVAVIQTAKPITPVLDILRKLLLTLAVAGAVGVLLAFFGGMFLAGRALVPIKEAFRRQREFVADASHELRTPLAIVRASAEVLDRDLTAKNAAEDDADTRELVDNILSESDRMSRLVGDLLTLARADSGELEVEVVSYDLADVAAQVTRKVNLLAKEKDVTVKSSLPARLPVEGDRTRMEQLLFILLDNAVKYSNPGGRVNISAETKGQKVEVRVADTGIGIPPGDLPRIFDRFFRVDKARSRAQGGTGLGLAIARWIVEAHGGSINAASEPGKGTEFIISLPLKAG